MGSRGDILIEGVDSAFMVEYETFLKSTGVCPNSSSYYMRNLRAIYNRAVDKGLTVQRSPFKHVYTGIDKTMKRAVSMTVIRQIRDLERYSEWHLVISASQDESAAFYQMGKAYARNR